jgi:hypothetical protein
MHQQLEAAARDALVSWGHGSPNGARRNETRWENPVRRHPFLTAVDQTSRPEPCQDQGDKKSPRRTGRPGATVYNRDYQ